MTSGKPIGNDYLLSSIPARWIDNLIHYSPEFGTTKSLKLLGARGLSLLISQTIFPSFLNLDLVHYSIKSLVLRACSVCRPDAQVVENEGVAETARRTHDVAMKCLRGVVASPAGLIWRDVVSNHYLADPVADDKIHPTGGMYSSAALRKFPTSGEEVREHVRSAIREGKKVSIAGAGYCQGKQTLPPTGEDVHINMSGVHGVTVDADRKVAVVGAGATWSQVQTEADKHGLAVQVMQASNVFSVGGSLSANCHGWDHTKGSLANTVNWITIVNAQGELQTLTPDDELFHYVAGGYGMFGVIVEVELNLAENEELFDFATKVDIADYHNYFRGQIQSNPNIKMHLYRLSLEHGKLLRRGWAQNYSTLRSGSLTEHLEDEPATGTVMDRILMQVARNSPLARTLWWQQEEKSLQKIKKMRRNEIMRPKINACFANKSSAHREWLQEYFVPGEQLSSFIEFLGKTLDKNDVSLFNASVRYVTKDERAALGYATEGDRFAVVLFFSQSLNEDEVAKTKRWVQEVVDKLATIDGTFYLPYAHLATQEQFAACYPQWKEVKEKKHDYDPDQLFDNGLFQDYFNV